MSDPSSAPNGDPIVVARFAVPMLPATFVRRPVLVRRLEDGLGGPLVLVNGPAGAGKTLLAAHWFGNRRRLGSAACAWLTAEKPDNAPGVFWAHVLEALRHHGVRLPVDIRTPADAARVDPALLERLAAHLHGSDPPVVLVVDEFDRITSPTIAAAMHELLRHSRPGLTLVLVSRSEPLLPLHRYRAAGELAEVRAADLAFSPDEAIELFAAHGLTVSAAAVRDLNERMDGWAAGLRLAALSVAEGTPDAETCLREFDAKYSTVADFLTHEVFEVQPAATRDLLLRTCILDQVHPDLADVLTGRLDGARILADLHRANAFVSPIGHGWYRYHPLFTEILRIRLRVLEPGLSPWLHGRAARWLSAHGQIMAALPYAAGAGEWDFAAALLVRSLSIGRLLAGRDATRLIELFAAMPAETDGSAPELVRAATALARQDPDQAVEHLRAARKTVPDGDGFEVTALRFTGVCLSVLAARLLGSPERAQAAADEAAELGSRLPRELVEAHPELSAHVLGSLGAVMLWHGRFAEAGRALAAAAEAPEATGTARVRYESLGGLGLIDVLDGRLARAEAHARASVAEAARSRLPPSAGRVAHLVLAEVAMERGELDDAGAALRRADAAVNGHQDPMIMQALGVARSRLLVARGKPEAALDALRDMAQSAPRGDRSPWLADRVAATASAAFLVAGRPDAAIAALDDADARAAEPAVASARARLARGEPETALRALDDCGSYGAHNSAPYVQALLVRAQAIDALGDPAAARRLVRRALAAADGERLRLPFHLASSWLRRTLRADPELTRSCPWLPADLRAPRLRPTRAAPDGEPPAAVEPLSERERQVLNRAAQLMSTEEIAADLYVSVNTVKTHLKNINRKLAASRRGEAVRRARELNLI